MPFEFFTEFSTGCFKILWSFFEYSQRNSVRNSKGTFIGFFQKSYDFAKTWVYLLNIVKSPLKMSLSSQSLREFRLSCLICHKSLDLSLLVIHSMMSSVTSLVEFCGSETTEQIREHRFLVMIFMYLH